MRKVVVMLLMSIFFFHTVHAVGIKGLDLRMRLDFVPNLTREIEYVALSNAGFTQNHSIHVKGYLSEYVHVQPSVVELPDGGQEPFKVTLNLPEKVDVPGLHPLEIFVEETLTRGNGNIGAKVAAVAQIFLRVLFPTKTLVSSLSLADGAQTDRLTHTVFVQNWGKTDFSKVWAKVSIFNENPEPVETLTTPIIPLKSAEENRLTVIVDGMKYEPGEYFAKVWVNADGVPTQEHNGTFRVGTFNVVMLEATATFKNNSINKFNIKIRNEWNKELPNVYALVRIGPAQVQTPTIVLKPWEERVLTGYWDTHGFEVGSHDAYIILYFSGKHSTAKVVVRIVPDLAVQTEQPISQANAYVGTLLVLVVLLVLLNVSLFYRLRRRKV